jgi:hypothetical protein
MAELLEGRRLRSIPRRAGPGGGMSELPKLIAALETVDTAVELCAIAAERPTAEALKAALA